MSSPDRADNKRAPKRQTKIKKIDQGIDQDSQNRKEMNRNQLRKYFKTQGPAILPVIHVLDVEQAARNVDIALDEGAPGVFLINHDFGVDPFIPIIREIRERYPALWLGVNFLGVPGRDAFPRLGELQQEGCQVDGYWADDARIDEQVSSSDQGEAMETRRIRERSGWDGLYFGGTAFKKQRPVDPNDYRAAATIAAQWMDVVTTSGIATGEVADSEKVTEFRTGVKDAALALASGINPQNFMDYAEDLDAVLVATGINLSGDFYNIDRARLRRLIGQAKSLGTKSGQSGAPDADSRENRWYLDLMAPRSRGEKYAWLDPSAAYINARSFHAMLDDLSAPFSFDEVDVVAGFDAAGFVLGAGIAARLGKGFLTIRKGGKIPVNFDVVPMLNYSGKPQEMEMRKPAFAPGTRVLLVDQWIETGGTMASGVELVERQGGVVAGMAVVCVEENPTTNAMREKYKTVSCVVPGSEIQAQCNRQTLASFADFAPEKIFPDIR